MNSLPPLSPETRFQHSSSSLSPALFACFAFGLSLCALLSTASATTVLKLNTESLSTHSESIAMARVETMTTVRRGGMIFTQIHARVVLPIKGDITKNNIITIERPGGRLDEFAQIIPGAADFDKGEDILVFMERPLPSQPPIVVGMAQGKYKLAVGPDEKLWAIRDTSQLTFAAIEELPNGGKRAVLLDHNDVDESGAVPLQTLLQDITTSLQKHNITPHTDLLKRLDKTVHPNGYDFELDFKNISSLPTTNTEAN